MMREMNYGMFPKIVALNTKEANFGMFSHNNFHNIS